MLMVQLVAGNRITKCDILRIEYLIRRHGRKDHPTEKQPTGGPLSDSAFYYRNYAGLAFINHQDTSPSPSLSVV